MCEQTNLKTNSMVLVIRKNQEENRFSKKYDYSTSSSVKCVRNITVFINLFFSIIRNQDFVNIKH